MTRWETLRADGHITAEVDLGTLTTYRLGGPARWFCEAESVEMVRDVAMAARDRGVEILILGRGSNLVISDTGYDGLVIRLAGSFRDLHIDQRSGSVSAGAALSLPRLARLVGREGLSGLEFYVGIPGSVGGAVTMNAGFFGTETAEVLTSASILDARSGSVTDRGKAELGLGYRTSNIGDVEVVLGASFMVRPGEVERISALMREATRWRRHNQPGGTLNAGSVFRNPPGDAAGRIIDSLGLKRLRRGEARVSTRHANFFVAGPTATAQDVYDLVHAVRRKVLEETGVVLAPEIRFAGLFRPGPDGEGDAWQL